MTRLLVTQLIRKKLKHRHGYNVATSWHGITRSHGHIHVELEKDYKSPGLKGVIQELDTKKADSFFQKTE
ncbi:hypothetical protein NDK43_07930 [Neobacillus pocheonensis]|uniref:Uncharacterized protein n=1 Tax=Neobacillus pocheonensis TaxID=363869 RepID=A0ABT0W7P5_9BACI|nr:hypothetical protein [Neobacillus pocheonensis]